MQGTCKSHRTVPRSRHRGDMSMIGKLRSGFKGRIMLFGIVLVWVTGADFSSAVAD